MEKEYRNLCNEYDTVFNSTTSALFFIKVVDSETFRYIRTNRSHQKATGITLEEIINKTPVELVGEELGKVVTDNYKRCYNAEEPVTYEEFLDLPGGKFIWETTLSPVIENNEVKYIVGSSNNITEHKIIFEKLRESEERFRMLLENVPSMAIQGYDLNGTTLYWNKASENLYGYSVEEAIGKNLLDLIIPPEMRSFVKEAIKMMAETGENIPSSELLLMKKDGSRVPVFSSHVLTYYSNRIMLYCIDFDLTDRKKAEEKIKSLLSEKEMLLKETHHRIKNNMTVLRSILSIEASMQNKHSDCRQILNDCSNRIMSMMSIYEYLYINEIKNEMDTRYYLKNLIDKLKEIYKHISFKTEVNIQEIYFKPKIISSIGILINELFANSVKYAFQSNENSVISISMAKNGENITLVFADNGVGLPDSVSFENNSSFGLKLINMLVREIGGTIKTERKDGTKYIIEFKN